MNAVHLIQLRSRRLIAPLLLLLAFAASGAGANDCIVFGLMQLGDDAPGLAARQDSAVEFEMALTDEALALLTTTDGSVGALLKRGETVPAWFTALAKSKFAKVKRARAVRWDELSASEQHRLLGEISKARNQDFYEDRRIHGLRVRDSVRVTFDKPTRFLGQDYPAGTHVVDTGGLLMPKVEYMNATSVKSVAGIELHARNSSGAARLSHDARTLQEGAGIPMLNQHVHIVASNEVGRIPGDAVLEATVKADFVRRANLVTEMIGVVEEGISVRPVLGAKGDLLYSSLNDMDLQGVTQYFEDVAGGMKPTIQDRFKMGAVGMHGADKYDQPGLWGLQVRAIDYDTPPALAQNLLESLEHAMRSGDYGLPHAQLKRWLKRASPASDQVALAWYNRSIGKVYVSMPSDIRSLFKGNRKYQQILDALCEQNEEVKMLAFDWSRDPVVFGNSALEEKILEQQMRAIKSLLKGDSDPTEVVAEFLVKSGLYEAQLASLKLKRNP